jgi:hypothetical protein
MRYVWSRGVSNLRPSGSYDTEQSRVWRSNDIAIKQLVTIGCTYQSFKQSNCSKLESWCCTHYMLPFPMQSPCAGPNSTANCCLRLCLLDAMVNLCTCAIPSVSDAKKCVFGHLRPIWHRVEQVIASCSPHTSANKSSLGKASILCNMSAMIAIFGALVTHMPMHQNQGRRALWLDSAYITQICSNFHRSLTICLPPSRYV